MYGVMLGRALLALRRSLPLDLRKAANVGSCQALDAGKNRLDLRQLRL